MERDDNDEGAVNVPSDELAMAARFLRSGEPVRYALPGRRVALCMTLHDVATAQRGKVPSSAVRLDRPR